MCCTVGGIPMKKQPEITDQTRRNFVDAFLSLNAKKPIEKITIREITAITGNNRSTFYRYFPDVYGILEYIESEIIEDVGTIIRGKSDGTKVDKTIVDVFIKLYSRKEDKLRILLAPGNRYHFFDALKSKLIPVFSEAFHIEKPDARTDYTFELFFSGMLSMIGRWIQHQDEIELSELTKITESFLSDWLLKELAANK